MNDAQTQRGDCNEVKLRGRIGRDPEIRTTTSGARFATVSLVTSETWKTNGVEYTRQDWHQVVLWGDRHVGAVEGLHAGARIEIAGAQLRVRKWKDAGGVVRYRSEVHVRWGGTVRAENVPLREAAD